MGNDQSDIESKFTELSTRLADVERRLADLEDRPVVRPSTVNKAVLEKVTKHGASTSRPTDLVPLLGRTLLVLSGAFLLRAVTESGVLHQGTGTILGIAYSVALVLLADREAGRGRRRSANFHILAAAFIVFPLLWEATVKFNFLSPFQGVAGLAAITALTLFLSWRSNSRLPAWVFTLASAATAIVLMVGTKMVIMPVWFLLAIGLGTLWLGYTNRWWALAWTTAAVVNCFLALMVVMFLAGRTDQVVRVLDPSSLAVLQLSAVIAYIGSFIGRSLVRKSLIGIGETMQGYIMVLLGIGGTIAVSEVAGTPGTLAGVVSLVLAACCYSASFVFIDRQQDVRSNFIFFTTLALLFTVTAISALLDGTALAVAFALAALLTGWLGSTRMRATLALHAAVYSLGAAVTSGLVSGAVASLIGPTVPTVDWVTLPVVVALGTAVCCSWFRVPPGKQSRNTFSRVSKYPFLAVVALGAGGIIVTLAAPLIGETGTAEPDRAVLAVLRTGVLAAAAICLALMGRTERFVEATWIVYAVLAAGLVKFFVEDVPAGRPVTLMASLFLFGMALIISPRLSKKPRYLAETEKKGS